MRATRATLRRAGIFACPKSARQNDLNGEKYFQKREGETILSKCKLIFCQFQACPSDIAERPRKKLPLSPTTSVVEKYMAKWINLPTPGKPVTSTLQIAETIRH
jgi:hypothetical protein